MGADPYSYYVPYEEDKNAALQKLRNREFEAGRYFPVTYMGGFNFPIDDVEDLLAPGKEHDTIDEAFEDSDAEGTGSILDIQGLSNELNICMAYVIPEKELIEYFGTDKPTREIIEEKVWEYWDHISNKFGVRGMGICITAYKDDIPSELYFGGFSFD